LEKKMIIKSLVIGPIEVNNYLVIDESTRDAALIDAGGDWEKTVKLAKDNNASIKYILNTHGHFDHTAGDYDIREKTGAKVFVHQDDMYFVENIKEHLALYNMPKFETPVIDGYLKDGQVINVGNLEFKVIHTPGH
jgi:glyoxylase-like metal-dependent hydrolase (beta-lactamase superfamily II)